MCRINDAQSAKSIKKSVVALLVDPSRPGPLSIKTRGDTAGEGRDIQPSCSALILEHTTYPRAMEYTVCTTHHKRHERQNTVDISTTYPHKQINPQRTYYTGPELGNVQQIKARQINQHTPSCAHATYP